MGYGIWIWVVIGGVIGIELAVIVVSTVDQLIKIP
jgi:hypothetical protein